MPTHNVNLTDELDRLVVTKVKSEEQQYAAELAVLRAAIAKGDSSGIARGDVFRRVRKTLKLSTASR